MKYSQPGDNERDKLINTAKGLRWKNYLSEKIEKV